MISFPTTNTATDVIYSDNPLGIATPYAVTTAEEVKGWIGDHLYDNTLSVADNIMQAVAADTFPTAYPITLKGMEFDVGSLFRGSS
jgi:hypothetical protein